MYHPSKKSRRYYASHYQDLYTDLGYDYKGHIFENTISKVILKNKNNKKILSRIERMILMLVESVKQIKTAYMISLDKNDTNVN